jgi:hypothetical protein
VAGKIVANIKLLEPFFPKIQALSERAKRWLFGCNSPCEWEATHVAAQLKTLDAAEIEVLAGKPRVKDVESVPDPHPAGAKEPPTVDEKPATSKKSGSKSARTKTTESGDGDTVPARTLRQEFQDRLKDDLKDVEARIADAHRAKGDVENQIKAIGERIKAAPDRAARQPLIAQRERLIQQRRELGSDADLGKEWEDIRRRLKGTERDYFESLTSAASKRDEYAAVKARKVDEAFGTVGVPMEVEHVYPRSKIFNTPGFEKLHWEDQIALFNYQPNLKLMSARINLARSNIEYARWSESVWSRFPHITRPAVDRMATLEAQMKEIIEKMIKNPSLIPRAARR